MSAKSLPGNELTRDDFRNWVIKESVIGGSNSHIVVPSADQAYDQYDMSVSGPWCGIVDVGAGSGEEMTMLVEEGIQINTKEIETGSTFATFGGEVWYNTSTKEYADSEQAGYYLVGYIILVLATNGCIRFEKTRYATLSDLT